MTKTRDDTPERNAQALVVEHYSLPLFWYDLYSVLLVQLSMLLALWVLSISMPFSSIPSSSHL
jgi:hypothetical protein